MIVQKHMIPHLKGLVMDILIPEGEGRGVIRGLPRPLGWALFCFFENFENCSSLT